MYATTTCSDIGHMEFRLKLLGCQSFIEILKLQCLVIHCNDIRWLSHCVEVVGNFPGEAKVQFQYQSTQLDNHNQQLKILSWIVTGMSWTSYTRYIWIDYRRHLDNFQIVIQAAILDGHPREKIAQWVSIRSAYEQVWIRNVWGKCTILEKNIGAWRNYLYTIS